MATTKVENIKLTPIYLKTNLYVLFCLGIDIIPVKDKVLNKLFRVYSFFMIGIMGLFVILEFLDTVVNFEGIYKMTFTLCYLITHFLGFFKMILMLQIRKKFWHHLETLENGIFKPNMDRGGIQEFILIKDAINLCSTQGIIFYMFVIVIITARGYYAASANFHQRPYYITNDFNETIKIVPRKTMPYATYMPFDYNESPQYEMVFAFQIYSTVIFGHYIGGADALICGFMMLIKAQFLIVKQELDTLIERSENATIKKIGKLDKSEDNYALIPDGIDRIQLLNSETQKFVKIFSNDIVSHHQKLIAICDEAENDFCYLMLIQFVSSLLIVCFQLFQVSSLPPASAEFLSMSLYLTLMLYQLFCYCWHGNEVTLVSGLISHYAYNINWLIVQDSVKQSLLLIMMRSQRPNFFTAGKFSILSLQTFMTIVRGAASYFMFLKQMT